MGVSDGVFLTTKLSLGVIGLDDVAVGDSVGVKVVATDAVAADDTDSVTLADTEGVLVGITLSAIPPGPKLDDGDVDIDA